ncbi:MAG: hypothetical protein G01um101419_775 [Parcubacteria group bacterium Gr01-1014_19]|nr:MAG: hypothetical protein G01um101419_775 [Parcubacteria group bacterium Gr01-1014_19]
MIDSKSLERKVLARKNLVEKIAKFSEDTAVKYGVVIYRSEGSSHTHIKWELKDVSSFSFLADLGHCMMGGNDLHIWHLGQEVFHIYYQCDIKECEVKVFEQGKWISALGRLRKNIGKVMARIKKEKDAQKEKEAAAYAETERLKRIETEAKRLGLR